MMSRTVIAGFGSGLTFIGTANVVDDETLVPLGLLAAGVSLTAWLAIRAMRVIHRFESRLDRLEERTKQLDRRRFDRNEGEDRGK